MDETRFGIPIPIWNAAMDEARAILIDCAKKGGYITYSELARSLRTHHFEAHDFSLFALIGNISEEEDDAGNGMLSALRRPPQELSARQAYLLQEY